MISVGRGAAKVAVVPGLNLMSRNTNVATPLIRLRLAAELIEQSLEIEAISTDKANFSAAA